jgi:hypothetical protein
MKWYLELDDDGVPTWINILGAIVIIVFVIYAICFLL